MKKFLIVIFMILTVASISTKKKIITSWEGAKTNKLQKTMVCEKNDCLETIIIPADFKDKELKIKLNVFNNGNYSLRSGTIRNYNIKVINLSNNLYTYQDNSLYLKTTKIQENYLDLVRLKWLKKPDFITMYRFYNSEPLMALYNDNSLSDEKLQDENITIKLKELGYDGISDLDKYYLDYFNKNYNTSFASLEDFTTPYINKIISTTKELSPIKETNSNLRKFYQNYFYDTSLVMKYNEKNSNRGFHMFDYSRKEKGYEDLNRTLKNINVSQSSEYLFKPFSFYLNGVVKNYYWKFNYGAEVGFTFNKIPKYGDVHVYYIDTLGNLLTDKITMRDEVDNIYITEEKNIEGYKLIKIKGLKKGTFKEEEQMVYYIYDIDNNVNNKIKKQDISSTKGISYNF